MVNTLSTILRSGKGNEYLLSVKQELFSALEINARDPDSVVDTLVLSSLMNSYVEGSASAMGLCGQTVRNSLKQQDPDDLLQLNDEIIKEDKGKYLRKPLILAIDWHDVMYYGDPEADGVIGTQPRKGTHWACKYGSISMAAGKCSPTLVVASIIKGDGRLDHVRRLLEHVLGLGLKVKLLLLDGGYYSADVINYLNSAGIKFIMRMPNSGKINAGSDFLYTTNATHRSKDEQATFRVVAVNGVDRYGHSELFIFATNTDIKPNEIRKMFRKRWRIETSYRMINMFLPRSTSRIYSRRLYFYLAVLMCNIWAIIKHEEYDCHVYEVNDNQSNFTAGYLFHR